MCSVETPLGDILFLIINHPNPSLCSREITIFSSPSSEEHTSELQSRDHVVCRLLLEKKIPKRTETDCSPRKPICNPHRRTSKPFLVFRALLPHTPCVHPADTRHTPSTPRQQCTARIE